MVVVLNHLFIPVRTTEALIKTRLCELLYGMNGPYVAYVASFFFPKRTFPKRILFFLNACILKIFLNASHFFLNASNFFLNAFPKRIL